MKRSNRIEQLLDEIVFEVSHVDRIILDGNSFRNKSDEYSNGYRDALRDCLNVCKEFRDSYVKGSIMKLREGDRVQIALLHPCRDEEIRENGCDPNTDGKTGTVLYEIKEGLYALKLDEKLEANPLHVDTVYDDGGSDLYNEYVENLVKLDF